MLVIWKLDIKDSWKIRAQVVSVKKCFIFSFTLLLPIGRLMLEQRREDC